VQPSAYAHAEGCTECKRALLQGEQLVRLLGQVEMPAPSQASLRRTSAQIIRDLEDPLRPAVPLLPAWPALAAFAAWALPLAFAQHRPLAGPWFESLSFALVAAGCAALAVSALRKLAVPAAIAASAALVLVNAGPGVFDGWGGMHCFFAELASAALPFALVAALVVQRRMRGSGLLYAGVAAAGALAGHAALDLTCPSPSVGLHLVIFHFGGVVVAAALGALAARAPGLGSAPAAA
jgi:hypothetical protein